MVTKTCISHGDYSATELKTIGSRTFYSLCPDCDIEAKKKEKQRAAESMEQNRRALLYESGVRSRFMNCSFDNYKTTNKSKKARDIIKKYCTEYSEIKKNGISMIMCGRPGTGKTHLACAIIGEIVKTHGDVMITTSYKMLSEIKETYSKHAQETEARVISKFVDKGLLIVDEVGVQFGSDAEKILFYQIINGRYENMMPTVMISNLDKESLRKFIGDRCFDRMKEGGGPIIVFDWDSHRR